MSVDLSAQHEQLRQLTRTDPDPRVRRRAHALLLVSEGHAMGQIVWHVSPHKDARAFVAFLDHLVATLPDGPMVIVLDTVGYHKSRLVKTWWMTHQDQVRPLWRPAYAPELTVLERVWSDVNDKLSCHRWWADLPALEQATAILLAHLFARFHQPNPGGIALIQTFSEAA